MSARAPRLADLELVSRGVCVRTGSVLDSMAPDEAGELLGRWRSRASRAGLREVLADRGDADLEAVRAEGSRA